MKINGPKSVGAVNQYKKNQDAQNSSSVGKTSKKKDQVEISSEAKELLGTQGVTSPEKLEGLKRDVSTGNYRIDARTLAEKIFPFLK